MSVTKYKTIVLNITKTGIRRGKRKSATLCPVARAIRRRGFRSVTACRGSAYAVTRAGQEVQFKLPPVINKFISTFDHKGRTNVLPFSATVRVRPVKFGIAA
jgi:hypothetical protein